MKNRLLLIVGLLLAVVVLHNDAYAQLSKKEKKEWKKKKKAVSIEAFKSMTEENSTLKSQVSTLNSKVNGIQSSLDSKNAEISRLETKARSLESDVKAAQQAAAAAPARVTENSSGERMISGVVFKVQIGAFRNKDLSKYFDKNKNFSGESSDDGVQKFTLGQFVDYWEADTFKKYLREMGVKDAWIVSYKDGTRVPLKDVLEGVI